MRTLIARRVASICGLLAVALVLATPAGAGQRQLTPLQFRDLMIERLAAASPPLTAKVLSVDELEVSGGEGGTAKLYLGNAYRMYLNAPEDLDDILRRFVGLAASAGGARAEIDPQGLRLLIRHAAFVDDVRRMYAEGGKPLGVGDLPLNRPLAGDLVALVALDHPESYSYPPRGDLEKVMAADAVWERALANTRAGLGEIVVAPLSQGVVTVSSGNGLGASLMLLDEVWTRRDLVGPGDPIVVVISRTVLMVGHEGDARSIDALDAALQGELSFAGNDVVSAKMYIRHDGTWRVFDPAAPRRMPREAALDRAA